MKHDVPKKSRESQNSSCDESSDDVKKSESEYELEDEGDEDWVMEESDS